MAKSKAKVSSTQRNKVAIETAKLLKKKGVLSKNTKLHGGKYISRAVLKKVQEFQHVAKPSYKALKVTKAIAQRAKAEGYQVVQGNRVIIPANHEFEKRVKRGDISGIRPVRGGFMSEVVIPFNPDNSASLLNWLEHGNLDDLKLEDEMFAFSFHENMSYRAFYDAATMRKYLEHYKQDEMIKALRLFRLHPEDQRKFILGRTERERIKKAKGKHVSDRRESGRSRYAERMARLEKNSPAKYARVKAEEKERSRLKYEKKKSSPEFVSKSRKAALERYHRTKDKK